MSESLEGAWCVQQRATWHHKYRLLLTLKLNRLNVYPGFFNGGCVGLFLRPCLHIYRYFWKLIFSPLFYKIILIRVMLWKPLFLEDSKLQVLSWSKTIGCSHRFKDNRIQDPKMAPICSNGNTPRSVKASRFTSACSVSPVAPPTRSCST